MPSQADARTRGLVFDEVAADYDRHRPTYPDALVDQACEGIAPGSPVLEIGCGTGQLTRSLLARGLRVTAVEPGQQLIARARDRLNGAGDVELVNARLEDASLPRARYAAVFSASAIHWIDPDVGWRTAADALAGARARRENISEVWAWLGSHDIARGYAADLFDDVQIVIAAPMKLEHTADELNALLGTMSFWARLSPRQRDALLAENQALHQRLGRPIRSSAVACLAVARRRPRST